MNVEVLRCLAQEDRVDHERHHRHDDWVPEPEIASIPIALVYNLFLDRFIAGFTVGAVK